MLVRNDPGAWPLGPQGFWEGMRQPSVLQHRIFVLLVIVFGLFEWMVRTGRLARAARALLFPLLCAVGGGLLLTHSHASLNLKDGVPDGGHARAARRAGGADRLGPLARSCAWPRPRAVCPGGWPPRP